MNWSTKNLPDWMLAENLIIPNWQWVALFAAILVGLVLKKMSRFFLKIVLRLTKSEKFVWHSRFLSALEGPGGLLIASLFWMVAVKVIPFQKHLDAALSVTAQILFSIALTWTAYSATGVLVEMFREWAKKTETHLDDHLISLVGKSLKVFVVIFGLLVSVQNLGFNVMSVLAGLGLGGLAFALAAKDTCANLFGSLMILLDRPFSVGDWIAIGNIQGTVEEIGFRSTRVRTAYNSLVSVPNANIVNMDIDNWSRRPSRRVVTQLGVTYNTAPKKLEAFIDGIRRIIQDHPRTGKDSPQVVFSGYGASSLDILVEFFLIVSDRAEELRERQDVFLKILRLAEETGVSFAFPTQTLHVESLPSIALSSGRLTADRTPTTV